MLFDIIDYLGAVWLLIAAAIVAAFVGACVVFGANAAVMGAVVVVWIVAAVRLVVGAVMGDVF